MWTFLIVISPQWTAKALIRGCWSLFAWDTHRLKIADFSQKKISPTIRSQAQACTQPNGKSLE